MTALVSSAAEEELLLAAAVPLAPAAASEVAGLCSSFSTVQTRGVHDVAHTKEEHIKSCVIEGILMRMRIAQG